MKKVLYITATLPALTVTFIYNEIFRLRQSGVQVDTVSMNTPADSVISADARTLRDTTVYLDQVGFGSKIFGFLRMLVRNPRRTLRCCRWVVSSGPVKGGRDVLRLAYHLVEAAYLAHQLRGSLPDHIHSHFINGPTSIAMFLGELAGKPFSFTMHASMIWLDPIAFRRKLDTCAFCVSISEYNKQYVLSEYGRRHADKIRIIHCGIDPETELSPASGSDAGAPVHIVGVGQLNARKGFHVLMPALAILKSRGLEFRCTIVGDGAERANLSAMVEENGLQDDVVLAGAMLHEQVRGVLDTADLFVLPCVISDDGWRDGIPVALMEAMYCQVPVVSTNILGLPELIEDGTSGLLVPQKDAVSLAEAMSDLIVNPGKRREFGIAGRRRVETHFNNAKSAAQLKALFQC